MTDTDRAPSEREEIEMLLPWYVTGRLDADEHERVENYLDLHPEMRVQLALIEAERFETALANEAIPAPSPGALDRLMGDIAASGRPARASASVGILERIREFFIVPSATAVRWAAVAAAVVIIAQAATIGTLVLSPEQGGTYQSASGGDKAPATGGTFALIRFQDGATAKGIAAALGVFDATIVEGPLAGGFYKVRIHKEKLAAPERDARIGAMRERGDVFLLVTPSQ